MITYVNTVFVNNTNAGAIVASKPTTADKDKFVLFDVDKGTYVSTLKDEKRIKIGLVSDQVINKVNVLTGAIEKVPVIKWSNVINKDYIKSFASGAPSDVTKGEDTVKISFEKLDADTLQLFNEGGKRLIVRLTFKDLPTRFRKWTESYEYTPEKGCTAASIAKGLADTINKQYKRARVSASVEDGAGEDEQAKKGVVLVLTALPYDDDNSVDTINVANKVRFNVNVYYTNPEAAGFASKNKYFPTGVTITKTPGKIYPAEAKLVRDREAQAMGYEGILNRGCCTWPIIKPAMKTDLNAEYSYATLEFENMYHAADDIQRNTKQSVEIYSVNPNTATGIIKVLSSWVNGATE